MGVQIVASGEHCCDVEDHSDEDESDTLGVPKEESRDVSFLDSSLSRNDKEISVSVQDKVNVLGPKCDHCSVVDNDV